MSKDIIRVEEVNEEDFDILLESYKLADAQLQMRIQQRDNFGIQLMVAFGVLLSAMTVENDLLRRICILAMPIVSFYFCNQVFSSYDVHSRLVYFIKNNLELQMKKYTRGSFELWENFCEYDRRFRKVSRLGGRKDHFMIMNLGIPIFAFILYIVFFGCYRDSIKSLFTFDSVLGVFYFGIWEIIAIKENERHKGNYQEEMNDLLAKCGFIDDSYKKTTNSLNRAVFLDRDGTIHVDKVETRRIEDLEFFDDTVDFLVQMNKLGYLIVIVTNQSGIGKGHYSVDEMRKFNDYMIEQLAKQGVKIAALYYCPHINQDNCRCKKPKDGMFRRAAIDLNILLSESVMIGDQSLDAYAGIAAGIGTNYIVTTGIYKTDDGNFQLPNNLIGKVRVFGSLSEIAEDIKRGK